MAKKLSSSNTFTPRKPNKRRSKPHPMAHVKSLGKRSDMFNSRKRKRGQG
jgi:hypothetical protein